MKYIYYFSDSDETIEIDEKWFWILREMDQDENNNNHTETRWHTCLTEATRNGLDEDTPIVTVKEFKCVQELLAQKSATAGKGKKTRKVGQKQHSTVWGRLMVC